MISGAARDIALYVGPDGVCQVKDYLDEPKRERAKVRFFWIAEKLAEFGRITNEEQFRHEDGEIWGMKLPDQERVACFRDERLWVCTHAFHKNGKWRKADFDRANAIREDYFQRKEQES